VLNNETEKLRRLLPQSAQNWGTARKAMRIKGRKLRVLKTKDLRKTLQNFRADAAHKLLILHD